MPEQDTTTNLNETPDERAQRLVSLLERIVSAVGEHAEWELKGQWRHNTPYLRAEFIKDIQSIANSEILPGHCKHIAVGVDEATRTITGCNHVDYDDAPIHQLLSEYLDRVPEFEVLRPFASNGRAIVIIIIPQQAKRLFIVKKTISDQGKVYLSEGEVWHKPGGPTTGRTGKQRATTREAFIAMLDIEAVVHNAATERINQMLPTIRIEERSRLGSSSVIPALTATDDEFQLYVEQALTSDNEIKFNILLEKIREKTVSLWETVSAGRTVLAPEEVLSIKELDFLPAMRRLTQLGLILIKFSAPPSTFLKVADQLFEVLRVSSLLQHVMPGNSEGAPASLAQHSSYSVPAIESLCAAYLLAGFSLTRNSGIAYFSSLFRRSPDHETSRLYLSWPYDWKGAPNRRIDLLANERFGGDDHIKAVLGRVVGVPALVLQADCLIEWHSFLSSAQLNGRQAGDQKTIDYFAMTYGKNALNHTPAFVREELYHVIPTLRLIATALRSGDNNFCALDAGLASVLRGIDPNRRLLMLGNFIIYAEKEYYQRRLPGSDVWWPDDLGEIVEKARSEEMPA